MPGTTAGGVDNLLLSLPTDIKKMTFVGSESARLCLCRINRKPGPLLEQWNEVSTKKSSGSEK